MGIHQKVTGRSSSLGSGIAAGVAVALALTLLLGALLAFFISREVVQQENLGYGVMVILFLAADWRTEKSNIGGCWYFF